MRSALYALLLASAGAVAAPVTCLPSTIGGLGSQAVYHKNDVGRWIGWWCPGETGPTVFACRAASCAPGSAMSAALSALWDSPHTATLNGLVGTLPGQASVSDVWLIDLPMLDAVKPK